MAATPRFVVLGAQKSATTFLQHVLLGHPDVWMPPGETDVFEDHLFSPSNVAEEFDWFPDDKIVGIKRPEYLAIDAYAGRLREWLPDAKYFAVLRNPIDRAISAYFHYLRFHTLPVQDIEVGLRQCLDGGIPGYPLSERVLTFGLYGRQVARYRSLFPENQLLWLLFDDVASDPAGSAQQIASFIGADPDLLGSLDGVKAQVSNYSYSRLRFLRLRAPLVRRWGPGRTFVHTRPWPKLGLHVWNVTTAFDRWVLARFLPGEKPTLSPELHDRMREYYEPDLMLLERELGRPVMHWLA